MRQAFLRAALLACASLLLPAPVAVAAGLYSQLVIPFPSDRPFSYEYVKADNALILAFQKTVPAELGAIDHYDERLVRRVLMKDLGPAGTEVRLVLRDRKVRAMVTKFSEPFRVVVDLFDADYEEQRDPVTGLPLAASPQPAASGAAPGEPASPFQLLDPHGGGAPTFAETPAPPAAGAAPGKRRLLQALPQVFEAETDLAEALRATPEGLGKAWSGYPPYVYRIQTAGYEGAAPAAAPNLGAAMTSAAAMADHAGKLFDFGHETRALLVYQQVLHRDPTVFDKTALHLWKLAEAQLGQGNLTLARGYYQALLEKHPESPLAQFARLRILDVAALRLISQDRAADLPTLAPGLDAIRPRHVGELQAQLALRRAWWSKEAAAGQRLPAGLPPIEGSARADLATAYPSTESAKTAFLAASLLLADMARPDTAWQRATGPFAEAYFKRFTGAPTEAYRVALRDSLYAKLNANLQAKVAAGKLVEAIDDFEALPQSMRGIGKTSATAWALAEAYRKLSQGEKAVDLYAAAAKSGEEGPERFKAQFWLSVTAGDLAGQTRSANNAKAQRLTQLSRDADRSAGATWDRLKDSERNELAVAYKDSFEKAIKGAARLRTPARIVLSSWTGALSTRAAAQSGGDTTDWQRNFSPSGSAVILLTDLATRFAELGMQKERRQTVALLKQLKPSQFEDDKAAKEIWSRELVKLAEDHRNASEYLEAGRLYSLVGAESENWEGRAEALYKGGLLLFRAGRRQEAMDAFRKASEDGNNLFYANLAKERIAQLE